DIEIYIEGDVKWTEEELNAVAEGYDCEDQPGSSALRRYRDRAYSTRITARRKIRTQAQAQPSVRRNQSRQLALTEIWKKVDDCHKSPALTIESSSSSSSSSAAVAKPITIKQGAEALKKVFYDSVQALVDDNKEWSFGSPRRVKRYKRRQEMLQSP